MFSYYEYEQIDKPSSVVNGHLSRPAVAGRLKRHTKCAWTGRLHTYPDQPDFCLAPSGVYICPRCYQKGGELLPHLSTFSWKTR